MPDRTHTEDCFNSPELTVDDFGEHLDDWLHHLAEGFMEAVATGVMTTAERSHLNDWGETLTDEGYLTTDELARLTRIHVRDDQVGG